MSRLQIGQTPGVEGPDQHDSQHDAYQNDGGTTKPFYDLNQGDCSDLHDHDASNYFGLFQKFYAFYERCRFTTIV